MIRLLIEFLSGLTKPIWRKNMKKLLMLLIVGASVSGCVGFVDGKSKDGRTVRDMYVLHPVITISGYTSGL